MFQPAPGDFLRINGITYEMAEHPSAPKFPFGQEGRQAIVYKISSIQGKFALKVFKPRYRRPYLVKVARTITPYAEIPGMEVCNRSVVSTDQNMELLKTYPELIYAVLMPWIEGPTWMEIILSKKRLKPLQCLRLARLFLKTLVALEENGLSHGDLSGANTILPVFNHGEGISLVDVEQLYVPGIEPPETMTEGSPGYGFPYQAKTEWGPYSDRFPGSIMIAEMLTFCDERVVEQASGETFFAENEPGKDIPRFRLMVNVLEETWGQNVASLFSSNWYAEMLEDCAPFAEWLVRLPEKPSSKVEGSAVAVATSAVFPDASPSSIQDSTEELENLLVQAGRSREQGDLRGALELYSFVLQSSALPDDIRTTVETDILEIEAEVAPLDEEEAEGSPPSKGSAVTTAGPVSMSIRASGSKNRKKMLVLAAVIVAVVVGLGLFFALLAMPTKLQVPKVIGMSEKDARTTLSKAGLKCYVEQREDNSIEPGKVLAQNPAANKKVEKGKTVAITISVKGKVICPNVVGVDQDQALEIIKQVSLVYALYQSPTPDQSQHGVIIAQDPPAGSTLEKGTTVTLQVGVYQPPAAQQSPSSSTSKQNTSTNQAPASKTPQPAPQPAPQPTQPTPPL